MRYVTIAEMSRTLRSTFHKVPHDVDFVLGVPRSGMIPASIIAEWLNVPCVDVDSYCFGASPTGGARLRYCKDGGRRKQRALVVDDTIFSGRQMRAVREKLRPIADCDFIYLAVYLEDRCTDVDVWLEDLRDKGDFPFNLFEWNIFNHAEWTMLRCIYDIDGVFCLDPPNEKNEDEYLAYITRATPLFLPKAEIGEIVSFRLAVNEGITRGWLDAHGIRYKRLTLFPADHYLARGGRRSADWKADIYAQRGWARLFVESEDQQARDICGRAGKPVYCVESNKLYQ